MSTRPRPTGEYQQIRAEIGNLAPDLPDTRKAYAGYLEADNGTQFGNTRQRRQAGRARGRFLRELKRAARTARQEAR